MSLTDALFSVLQEKCSQYSLDFPAISNQLLTFLGGAQPVTFLFGRGFAPENPTVFVDVLVLTDRLLVSLDMSAGSNTLMFFKISEIRQVVLTTYTDHVRLQLTLSGIGSVYVNADLGEYLNVQQFALTLRDSMRSIF